MDTADIASIELDNIVLETTGYSVGVVWMGSGLPVSGVDVVAVMSVNSGAVMMGAITVDGSGSLV